jgi:hypothetical protein
MLLHNGAVALTKASQPCDAQEVSDIEFNKEKDFSLLKQPYAAELILLLLCQFDLRHRRSRQYPDRRRPIMQLDVGNHHVIRALFTPNK